MSGFNPLPAVELNDIIQQCWEDSGKWFPVNTSTEVASDEHITFLMLALGGETGEAQNVWKKYLRGSITREEALEKLDEELIDVFIYLCNLFKIRNMRVGEAYAAKREFNQQRFDRSADRHVSGTAAGLRTPGGGPQ